MLARVDLPELILEIAARTSFTDAFIHLSERTARATDLQVSICDYLRDDTITAANTMLLAAQSRSVLAGLCGGGEVALADGMRFVVAVRSVHFGPNPKYFGVGRGVTWYKLISNQLSGLNDILCQALCATA